VRGWLDANVDLCVEEVHKAQGLIQINTDKNSSTILAKDTKFYERTKQIPVRYHTTRELVIDEIVRACWNPREENPADLGTKALLVGELEIDV
jgi:hypothetical protein